jgi:DNA mismatch repair protein MSH5
MPPIRTARFNTTPRRSFRSHSNTLHHSSPETSPAPSTQNPDDSLDIIMALDRHGSKTGCSFYTISTETLSLMEDLELCGPDIMDTLLFQIQPTILLIPSRLEDMVPGEDTAESAPGRTVSVRPSTEFKYEAGREKLISLRIGEEAGPVLRQDSDGHGGRKERLVTLAAWVDVDSRVTVGCAGAVLTHLQRRRAIEGDDNEQDGGGSLGIAQIEMFSLKDVMFVNRDAIASLQIFESESHPDLQKQGRGGRGKEGLSLFGIVNSARSPLGQRLLKEWFLRPSLSLEVVRERHECVEVLLKGENIHVVGGLAKCLKKVKNIPKIIAALKRGKGGGHKGGEWSAVLGFVFNVLKIRTMMQEVVGARKMAIYNRVGSSTLPVRGIALKSDSSWRRWFPPTSNSSGS